MEHAGDGARMSKLQSGFVLFAPKSSSQNCKPFDHILKYMGNYISQTIRLMKPFSPVQQIFAHTHTPVGMYWIHSQYIPLEGKAKINIQPIFPLHFLSDCCRLISHNPCKLSSCEMCPLKKGCPQMCYPLSSTWGLTARSLLCFCKTSFAPVII